MTTLGRRVAQARAGRGWDQRRLADEIKRINPTLNSGVSTISSIETGKARRTSIVYELAEALGVTERWLMTGEGPKFRGAPAVAPSAAALMDRLCYILAGVLERLGLDREESAELLAICREFAEEPPPDAGANKESLGRIQGMTIARGFLPSVFSLYQPSPKPSAK
jgi:transcriptional regulator with XRE-family HTH domain